MSIDKCNTAFNAWGENAKQSSFIVDYSDDDDEISRINSNESNPTSNKETAENAASKDIREHMNIKHFEEIQKMFFNHVNEDGSSGFALDMFLKVFSKVLGGNLSEDQLTILFNKIDANSDGTVSWDEFSSYMMTVTGEEAIFTLVLDQKSKKLASAPHRDMILFIDFIQRERKYITVSREGNICLWSTGLKLQRIVKTRTFSNKLYWICDAKYLHDHNRLAIVTDDRRLCFFDVTSIRPRLIITISQLEYNPLCLSYSGHYDDDTDLLLIGDDGGYVNVFKMKRKFLVDNSTEADRSEMITAHHLMKRDSFEKYNISMFMRKVHKDWVLQVRYFEEMNAYVTCASESENALIIGDLERKTSRSISVFQGVKTFDFCRRPSFLITAGRDKIIRLWNPYVLSKAAGTLHGHLATIVKLRINHEEGHIISLSEDKMIKIWNARNLQCLQTVVDRLAHRPENIISSIFYDMYNRQLVTGSEKIETWPLYTNSKRLIARTYESPLLNAMFNHSFHQIVTTSQDGTFTIWDPQNGRKIFQFNNAHGKFELTAACFDKIGRRLITGSRDGTVKMWNYNNGQILKKMNKDNSLEVSDIAYVEMGSNRYIIAVGWDRKLSVFIDDPDEPEADPIRILNGSGYGYSRGHLDDIMTVAFYDPNWLATGSVDGTIIVWNIEQGSFRFILREPFLSLRNHEEKPVEKVAFFLNQESGKLYLISCHADGCIRFWDLSVGTLESEVNIQLTDEEGLTSMALDEEEKYVAVSGSKGHIRIIDLNSARKATKDSQACIQTFWRAHTVSICSISYVNHYQMIITASKDCSVRLWKTSGQFIGILGQDLEWRLSDPSSYFPLPFDVDQENELEKQRQDLLLNKREEFKKTVLETWRGVPTSILSEVDKDTDVNSIDFKENVKRLRIRSIQSQCLLKLKEFWARRKEAADWTIQSELVSIQRKTKFFSYQGNLKSRPSTKHGPIKPESIFHFLTCHDLEQVHSDPVIATKGTTAPKLNRKVKI